jgi:hypothetical protein
VVGVGGGDRALLLFFFFFFFFCCRFCPGCDHHGKIPTNWVEEGEKKAAAVVTKRKRMQQVVGCTPGSWRSCQKEGFSFETSKKRNERENEKKFRTSPLPSHELIIVRVVYTCRMERKENVHHPG